VAAAAPYAAPVAGAVRQRVLKVARDLRLEPQLRAVQVALEPRRQRRNRRDDEHLKLLLRLSLAADACCIDVGANVGEILGAMVAAAPHGHHIAFEPLPELAADLRTRFPGVDVREAALAREPGQRTFRRVVGAQARSGFHESGYADGQTQELTVEVQALDVSLPAAFVPAVVKIDVEGAEVEVIEGAMRLLCEHRPTVALEHGGPEADSRRVYELLVGEAGLRAFDLDGGGPLDEAEFVARVGAESHWNFVFHT
jgi:FkbM family methyltransferase